MPTEQSPLSGAGMSGYGAIAVADHSVSFAMTLAVFALFEFSPNLGEDLQAARYRSLMTPLFGTAAFRLLVAHALRCVF